MKSENSFYKEYPKTCAPDDFWGQVKRTVGGKPVDESQIQLIVNAIVDQLDLAPRDRLLDLCCGNGALTDRLTPYCDSGLGVDFSEYLIEVARANFAHAKWQYRLEDVVSFLSGFSPAESFTKAMCYGSFMYLVPQQARQMLLLLHRRFPTVARVFIGNLPDRSKARDFFSPENYQEGIENDPGSALGIWRSQEQMRDLAKSTGWKIAFHQMPEDFYSSAYRYDALLYR